MNLWSAISKQTNNTDIKQHYTTIHISTQLILGFILQQITPKLNAKTVKININIDL